jgi:hypothetical protein
MSRLRIVWAVALVALVGGAARAETLINADFSKDEQGFVLLVDAKLVSVDGRQVLSLTQNEGGQKGLIWSSLKRQVPSFSVIADIRVRFVPPDADACPADGLSINFAPVETDAEGAAGGSLGIFGGEIETFTSFEVNTWRGQGLGEDGDFSSCTSGRHETFAFNVIHPNVTESARSAGTNGTPEEGGPKIGQTLPPAGAKIVNGERTRRRHDAGLPHRVGRGQQAIPEGEGPGGEVPQRQAHRL